MVHTGCHQVLVQVLVTTCVITLADDTSSSSTRTRALHPTLRFARNIAPLTVSEDSKSRNVQSWLESYQDLLGKFTPSGNDNIQSGPSTTTTTTISPSTSKSLLRSFFDGFIPYLTGDNTKDQSSGTEPSDILSDSDIDEHNQDDFINNNLVKRQGLAFDVKDVESRRRHLRRPGKRRKIRRRSTTTERYFEAEGGSVEPDYKRFCRQVIKTLADNLKQDMFKKVSMYQEIWYLISKYNIPLTDHSTDIVILIDKLCKEDGGATEYLIDNDDAEIDNIIEHDDETSSFVYHSPAPTHHLYHHRPSAKSEYSSVARFPQFPLSTPSPTDSPSPSPGPTPSVYVSQLGENFPGGSIKQHFYQPAPSRIVTKKLPRDNQGISNRNQVIFDTPTRSQYPQVRYSVPRYPDPEPEKPDDKSTETAQNNERGSALMDNTDDKSTSEESNEPITLHPELIVGDDADDNLESPYTSYQLLDRKPQDILVGSSLSFGGGGNQWGLNNLGSHQEGDLIPGKVISDTIDKSDDDDDRANRNNIENSATPATHARVKTMRKFTPSELESSTVKPASAIKMSSSTLEPLRKGTVEDIPPPRPTLPPVVKTSRIDISDIINDSKPPSLSISSTISPVSPTTYKTSKIDVRKKYKAQQKYYKSYLKDIIDNYYEEPSRSTEEDIIEARDTGYNRQYVGVGSSGYFPRQREPYPYKNLAMPLPYLTPPATDPLRSRYSPSSLISNSREYDREDLMGNKMDDLKHIDGYIDDAVNAHANYNNHRADYNLYQSNNLGSQTPSTTTKTTTKVPKLSALTLNQLSTRLAKGVTKEMDSSTEMSREYTVFDMADAVTVTVNPPVEEYNERMSNHQTDPDDIDDDRARYVMYSENAPSRVRPSDQYADQYTLRPDFIEYDQSPSPASNSEHKLMVDMSTMASNSERPKRNVSVDDLLFLYNITFLTDSQEILPTIGERNVVDHNIDLEDGLDDETDVFDYNSLPLPDYEALNSEDKFNDALEEFLEDYEDYSNEKAWEHNIKHDNDQDMGDVEKLLSEFVGETSISKDLLGDVFEEDYVYEYIEDDGDDAGDWSVGHPQHRVNHKTHSVPEFANKLITQQREGSIHNTVTSEQAINAGVLSKHLPINHKEFQSFTENDFVVVNKDGIKEVLMVLNATGKTAPKNRTRNIDLTGGEQMKQIRDGYYPEHFDLDDIDYDIETYYDSIDDGIEQAVVQSGHAGDYYDEIDKAATPRDDSNDGDRFGITELDNDINNNHNSEIYADDQADAATADLTETDANNNDYVEEKKYFYPVNDDDATAANDDVDKEETTKDVPIDPQNLSDKILDSWDIHSDEILSNDQFKNELEKEKQEKAQIEQLLSTNSLSENLDSETFPLKSLMSDSLSKKSGDESVKTVESIEEDSSINPEKLAYILIGVCCGLSILCLIVVAISIGYKSETHYRLEEPRRKHIRLLKANNSDEDSNSSSSEQDDKSRAKLGNWFTGKSHIETMERKSNLVFPTSVYLDNLASSATHSTISRNGGNNSSTSSSPSVGSNKGGNMFEVERGDTKVGDIDGSDSSINSVVTDPNIVQSYDADSIDLHLDQQSNKKQYIKAQKTKSSYNLSSTSKFSKGEQNLSQLGLNESAREKFRFKSNTPSGRRNSNVTVKSTKSNNEKFTETEITWSENTDRLI